MTNYISTRGSAPTLGFSDVTLTGLANDGGLYVPEVIPQLSADDLEYLSSCDYVSAAKAIIPLFINEGDIDIAVIEDIIDKSYSVFDNKEIVPLEKLNDNFYIAELFHGPTLAFKDIALQFLGNVFEEILEKKDVSVTIVGATSGDTGSAAIEAFKGKHNADIFIMHPHGRVSDVQRKQMVTVADGNVFNIALQGSFDDCQHIVKELFGDKDFREKMNLSAVNSINWARILAQTVYYVYISAKLYKEASKKVTFTVPTGNFGNVYAGYIAKRMGAPIERLIVATNRNDILHRFFTTGEMKIEESHPSLSPSMDIQISSNFERLLFEVYERDSSKVVSDMSLLRGQGKFSLDDVHMNELEEAFASGAVDDEETLQSIKYFYDTYKYIADPHTAVGLSVAKDYLEDSADSLMVVLSTAHPAKFPDAIEKAIEVLPEVPERLKDVFSKEEKYQIKANDVKVIADFIENARI